MKNYGVLLFFLLACSCSIPSYVINNSSETGVNFSNGKWLLNEVKAPANVSGRLTALAIQDFSGLLKERLTYVPTAKGLLLPQQEILLHPARQTILLLKKGSDYDYFINIKAGVIEDNVATLDLTPHKLSKAAQTNTNVTLEIYDLNAGTVIYSQTVTGHAGKAKDNGDLHLAKSSRALVIGAYKKLIASLEKTSVK